MRGNRKRAPAGGREPRGVLPPTGITKTVMAPLGGWNTRDALAKMSPYDAVVMDNFFPSSATVDLRPGKVSWATGFTQSVKTLMAYNSGTTSKLFACTSNGIFDVTNAGAIGATVTTATNGKWQYRNITTSGGSYLVAVNGVDTIRRFDGTTWYTEAAGGGGVPSAITGVTTSTLFNVHLFKHRLWFLQKNSMTAYFLGVDSVGGAMTAFPMGNVFSRGGYLVAQQSWTFDGGAGVDDYLVTITSEGEAAIYKGSDPTSATDWSLVGTYYVGKPLGVRCLVKYGGDLLFLSKQGVFPLSKLLDSTTVERTVSLSDKIISAFKQASLSYGGNFGWQVKVHPTQSAVVINVPIVEGGASVQFVMNDLTKTWCRFTNWDADCFEVFQDDLYSALGTKVYKNWVGTVDDTMPIQGLVQQAYLAIGPLGSSIGLSRPNLTLQGTLTLQTAIDTDFALFPNGGADTSLVVGTGFSLWDTGLWDSATWAGGSVPVQGKWMVNTVGVGFFHSFRLKCTTSTATVSWVSTDYLLQKAGIL
jgi:hypothetical protein